MLQGKLRSAPLGRGLPLHVDLLVQHGSQELRVIQASGASKLCPGEPVSG